MLAENSSLSFLQQMYDYTNLQVKHFISVGDCYNDYKKGRHARFSARSGRLPYRFVNQA